jgi:uncharacterized protein (DUF2336 family)
MSTGARYSKLLELAHETSSEKRRALLNDVTDLFFESEDHRSGIETKMFGELMAKVAYELDLEVRKQLSNRFIGGDAPRDLAIAMAHDDIEVAAPILRRSRSLTQDDLVSVVKHQGDTHRLIVTERPDLGEAVSDALVTFGGDGVVASLLRNESARIADETFDKVLERAETNPELHAPIVQRQAIPLEHLNQLFMMVEGPMRREIMERNAKFSPRELDMAVERARTKIGVKHGALPEDFEAASRAVAALKARDGLLPHLLPTFWRNKEHTKFRLAFAELSGLSFQQISRLIDKKDIDGIAIVARASSFDRPLFVTIAVLCLGDGGMSEAEAFGRMYNDVSPEAAQRAVRFMKMRAAQPAQAA